MSRAYIALGSNLGDRHGKIESALKLLADESVRVAAVSSIHESAPVDCPAGSPPFLNAAAALETRLLPRELLARLLEVERHLGRHREAEVRNAPRTIDLDLLLYDDVVLEAPGLLIPHPRMHQRRFVLAPLAEIAAGVLHPGLRRTVAQLLAGRDAAESPTVRGGADRR